MLAVASDNTSGVYPMAYAATFCIFYINVIIADTKRTDCTLKSGAASDYF